MGCPQDDKIPSIILIESLRFSKIDRIVLHFDSRDMSLNLLKLEETSGDYIMYEFYQKKFNGTVDDNLFYIAK